VLTPLRQVLRMTLVAALALGGLTALDAARVPTSATRTAH